MITGRFGCLRRRLSRLFHTKGGAFAALVRSVAYVENPGKTDGGEWVTAYECDPLTVAEEFMFSKAQYAARGGRNYGGRDVIAYHLRISFKPGETDAETANKIGNAEHMLFGGTPKREAPQKSHDYGAR